MMNNEKTLTKTENDIIITDVKRELPSYGLKTYVLYRCDRLVRKTAEGNLIPALGNPETPILLSQMALSLGLSLSEAEIGSIAEANGLYLWDDNGICAIARVAFVGEKYARINTVFTSPEKRGHGYAGALVSSLAEKLISEGLTPTVLADEENPVSNHLYLSLGFTPDGRIYEYSKIGVCHKENAIFYRTV
jgi:GNAT superfamily N-acetyltransferase